METKSILASKTFWVNLVAVVAAVLAALGTDIDAELQATIVATVMGVVNIVLRLFTSKPVSMTRTPPAE